MTETKIDRILRDRNMSQGDLVRLIKAKSGFKIGRDRISKICTGRLTNYTVETARMISEALEVPMDEIVDIENVKKYNRTT
jgi:DNA-binding Xre family transcriptional regulator